MLKQLEYRLDLLDKIIKSPIYRDNNRIIVEKALNFESNIGSNCTELIHIAKREIKKKDYRHFVKAAGTESSYFRKGNHYFLLLFEYDPMDNDFTTNTKDIASILEHGNPIFYDPTLNRYGWMSQYGYSPHLLINDNAIFPFSRDIEIEQGTFIPIYNKQDIVYYLTLCNNNFAVSMQHPYQEITHPKILTDMNDSFPIEIQTFVQSLQQKEILEGTYKPNIVYIS